MSQPNKRKNGNGKKDTISEEPRSVSTAKEIVKKLENNELNIEDLKLLVDALDKIISETKKEEMKNATATIANDGEGTSSPSDVESNEMQYSVLVLPKKKPRLQLYELLNELTNGNDYTKHVLQEEGDLLYECKVCKSFFRKIPEFIIHKRQHCQPYTVYTTNSRRRLRQPPENGSLEEYLYQCDKEPTSIPTRRMTNLNLLSMIQNVEVPVADYETLLALGKVDPRVADIYKQLLPNLSFK